VTRRLSNIAASARARLLTIAHADKVDFLVVLQRFALERLLHRLARSQHADRFTLKGAMLFTVWAGEPHRATRDLDLLARGTPALDELVAVWRDVTAVDVDDDGVRFDRDSIKASVIREGRVYEGVRVVLLAQIESARIDLQIDVGFGDAVVPPPRRVLLPVLLDFPAPEMAAYAPETVVAEKLHAMVEHGEINTRLKDYYDIWWLMTRGMVDGALLVEAIAATFARRRTPQPAALPPALSSAFATNPAKERQWRGFCRRAAIHDPPTLPVVIARIAPSLWEALQASARR
jgi:predicted nucleotidyltransferase component of viral defense system